jgi:prophage maintenance system killer protein
MAAAAMFHSLVLDHAFHNGNKRTALVALLVMLDQNEYALKKVDQDGLYDYVLAIADHKVVKEIEEHPSHERADVEVLAIAKWLRGHMGRIQRQERILKFRDVRSILGRYDCTFGVPSGNRIDIYRHGLHTNVWHGDEGRDVERNTIQRIREDLELDEAHGYDSEIFYSAEKRIDDFILKYRRVLDRLAKV